MLGNLSFLNENNSVQNFNSKPNPSIGVYVSKITQPIFNSSIEKWLMQKDDLPDVALYLWRNDQSVFIGRNQNPYKECQLHNMAKDNVNLVRRHSGGGTVYHSLENTNFSFISRNEFYDKNRNYEIIINALKKFGVDAEIKGRNDIVVGDKKVSGSAYQMTKIKEKMLAVHHGTMLLNVDMAAFSKYLNPNKKKLASKGIASVQARVMNLSEVAPGINHQNMTDAIIKEFFKAHHQECPITFLDESKLLHELDRDPMFLEIYEKYNNWDWTYGETPDFEYSIDNKFDWGMIDVGISCYAGVINPITIHSDSLYPNMIDALNKHLRNKRYNADGINDGAKLACLEMDQCENLDETDKEKCKKYIGEFSEWLISKI